MKPYKIIHGSSENVAAFEDEVSSALEEGYELANRLIIKTVSDSKGLNKALFFQPMVYEEILDELFDDEDDEDEDNDEESNEL